VAESASDVTMERICPDPDCQHSNPSGSNRCQKCGKDIEFERDTPIKGAKPQTDEGGDEKSEDTPADENHSTGTDCPVCDASGTVINSRCSNCQSSFSAGFALEWDDKRLSVTAVSREMPLFIGRVPPVETGLAQHIESNYQAVSRMHAELYINQDGSLVIRDMGSQNGTKVNNERIAKFKPEQLKMGDLVSFSTTLSATVVQA